MKDRHFTTQGTCSFTITRPMEGINAQEVCKHVNTHLKTLEVLMAFETTVTACLDCGKHLDEPKTEFR